jgi:Transposase DDE domain
LILQIITDYIFSEYLKNEGRVNIKDFVRERILTFPTLVLLFINLAKKSLQVSLNEFCKSVNLMNITKQAFSKARKKLSARVFVLINRKLVEEYYTDNVYSKWNNFRLLAIDGTDIQLPNDSLLKQHFGTTNNQTGPTIAMAKVSYVYDVLNKITLDAQIDRVKTSERDLAIEHIESVFGLKHDKIKDLYLFDRGYPSLGFLFYLSQKNVDFVIRCSTSACFAKVREAYERGETDTVVRLYANQKNGNHIKELKKRVPELDRKTAFIDIRVAIVTLETGEKEILITSLLDQQLYSKQDLKILYNRRWGAEENYKWHKVGFEIENFSGNTPQAIEQEIFASVLTANMASLLIENAQEEIDNDPTIQARKHQYKINRRVAVAIMKDQLLEGILSQDTNMEELCERLKCEIKKNLSIVRPGRTFKRQSKNGQKFGKTTRRCL